MADGRIWGAIPLYFRSKVPGLVLGLAGCFKTVTSSPRALGLHSVEQEFCTDLVRGRGVGSGLSGPLSHVDLTASFLLPPIPATATARKFCVDASFAGELGILMGKGLLGASICSTLGGKVKPARKGG